MIAALRAIHFLASDAAALPFGSIIKHFHALPQIEGARRSNLIRSRTFDQLQSLHYHFHLFLGRYGGLNGNVVLVDGRREDEAESAEQAVEAVGDPLIEPVEAGALWRPVGGVTGHGVAKANSQRGVDAVEEIQEDQADGIALSRQ